MMQPDGSRQGIAAVPAVIEARELGKSFGGKRAVDGVDLQVHSGEIYGLVGSDGAGKTTTMRMLVGALASDGGTCSVGGHDLARHAERARTYIGYLSQKFSLYEDMTVLENIRFFAEVRGMSRTEWLPRCLEILEFVGLADFKDRLAGKLSGGMRQKLGLATALVTRPRALLLDEPTTGVDPVTRQDFWQLLISLVSGPMAPGKPDAERNTGRVAVLISTPYMDEAARCNRVGFMRHGRIIAEDTPSRLRARLMGRILELRGSPLALMRTISSESPFVETVRAFGDRLHLRTAPGAAQSAVEHITREARNHGGQLEYVREIPALLEDVFIYLSEAAYE